MRYRSTPDADATQVRAYFGEGTSAKVVWNPKPKGAGPLLTDLAQTGCDALGVDWTTDLGTARELVEDKVALQGNLDPATLRESPEVIREGVARTLASYGKGPGHVFNLGHGITPDIDPDNVTVLVDAVHEMSPQYHR